MNNDRFHTGREPMGRYAAALAAAGLVLWPLASHAATPCDFKGVSVGNKMTPAQIMTALGVSRFKTNPPRRSFEKSQPEMEKYGTVAAGEMEDWNIGPYCERDYCRAPYGVAVGNDNTPVKVFVAFNKQIVTEIDVSFSDIYWEDMLPILDSKYGLGWTTERSTATITDYETKKHTQREMVELQHTPDGRNPKTGDRCQIWARSIDVIFQHHDAIGPYHSELVIKLVSKNF